MLLSSLSIPPPVAIDGVLSGKYKPLDFRFFIGHTRYAKGELEDAVSKGKYQPIACSRPLVLKQCIQLPKPLWHEGKKGGCFCIILKNEFVCCHIPLHTQNSYCTNTFFYLQMHSLVLEFCGGELKEISKLELSKREDL